MIVKIPPPFPDPRQWDSIRVYQSSNNCRIWSLPSYSVASVLSVVNQASSVQSRNEESATSGEFSKASLVQAPQDLFHNEDGEGDDDEEDLLMMNEAWVERLSKSMKRKQKKAYKAVKKTK